MDERVLYQVFAWCIQRLKGRRCDEVPFNRWYWYVKLPTGVYRAEVYYLHLQNQWVVQILGMEDVDTCIFLQDKRRKLNEYLTEVWYSDFREDPLSEEGEYGSSYDPDWHTQATKSSLF